VPPLIHQEIYLAVKCTKLAASRSFEKYALFISSWLKMQLKFNTQAQALIQSIGAPTAQALKIGGEELVLGFGKSLAQPRSVPAMTAPSV
jgi:hypothetical protein